MKNRKIALFSLLALAMAITAGCGGGGRPTFTKMVFASDREAATPLFVANLDGTSLAPVTNGPTNFTFPSISANGKKVAFVSEENVWTMNVDGTGKKQLTTATDDEADQGFLLFPGKIVPQRKEDRRFLLGWQCRRCSDMDYEF